MRLADRVAVVTGAGRGIGRAIALRLAQEGAAVVVNDIEPSQARSTAARIAQADGRAIADGADVREMDQVLKMFSLAASRR